MPVFIAAIGGMLINIVGTLAGRVLIGLGIGVITYTGMNTTMEFLKTGALAAMSGMGPQVVSLIAFLKVGVCISIITSAIATRVIINGISGDSFKRWVLK